MCSDCSGGVACGDEGPDDGEQWWWDEDEGPAQPTGETMAETVAVEIRQPVTIEQLYEYVKQLVEQGHGEYPVNIVYETVFGYATKLDFVKPTKKWPNGGLFVEE